MSYLDTIVIIISVCGSIIGSAKCVVDYFEHREKEIRRLVALSCEYTYVTYLKNIKKNNNDEITEEQLQKSIDITKTYFKNKCSYIISDKILTLYIKERTDYINSTVKKKK